MATESLRIYPRGFIGHADVAIGKDEESVSLINQIIGNAPKESSVYNSEVTSVYEELIKTPYRINQFEIRERILKAALTCFGFKNFYDWVFVQQQSNTLDVLAAEFIEDTVRFIQTGKRRLSIVTWDRLIDPKQRNTSFKYSEAFLKELRQMKAGTNEYAITQYGTIEIIQAWCTQPNGIEDMCATLYILFGRFK